PRPHSLPTRRSSDLSSPARTSSSGELSQRRIRRVAPTAHRLDFAHGRDPVLQQVKNGVVYRLILYCHFKEHNETAQQDQSVYYRSEEHTSELQSRFD